MSNHILKTIGTCWDAIESGEKTFEVRRNDRFFQRGDTVLLRRIDNDGCYSKDPKTYAAYTTRDLKFRIGWILQGGQFGIEAGYIVFQLEPLSTADAEPASK